MVILAGTVTGRKKGEPKENGKVYHTLKLTVGNRDYYPLYEESLLPNVQKDQDITLLCTCSARSNYLNLFVQSHIADEKIIDVDSFVTGTSSFDDF